MGAPVSFSRAAITLLIVLGASGGVLAALLTIALRFGKPDASITANGCVCGLISFCAGAPFLKFSESLLVGLAAGVVLVFAVEIFRAGLFTGYGPANFLLS